MSALVTVSELLRSVQHFYNHHDSSVSADLKHAHRIRNKLRSFAQTVKEDFGFSLGLHLGTERDENFVIRAVISYCEYCTLLICYSCSITSRRTFHYASTVGCRRFDPPTFCGGRYTLPTYVGSRSPCHDVFV